MKTLVTMLVFFVTTNMVGQTATSFTWTNGGGDNDYENNLNWTPDPLIFGFLGLPYPSYTDEAYFDGSFTSDNCIIPNDADPSVINLLSSYNGTVDASSVNVTTSALMMYGGTFLAPTAYLYIRGTLYKTGTAVFNVPSTNTLNIFCNTTPIRLVSGSFPNLANLEITAVGSGNRSINFTAASAPTPTCVNLHLNGGANPFSYRGNIVVTNSLRISGTASGSSSPGSNDGNIILAGAGSKTITGTTSPLQNPIPNIIVNTSSTLSISNNITIASTPSNVGTNSLTPLIGGTYSVVSLGGFVAGTSTVTMRGGTITAGNTSTTQAFFDNLSTVTGSNTVWTSNSIINLKANLDNSGSISPNNTLLRLSGTGSQAISSAATFSINAIDINNTGTKTLSSPVEITDSLKISAAGTLASGGNLTIKATSALKGRIAEIFSGGAITGNVTIETFALGGNTDWALLGAGVNSMTMNDWYDDFPMAIEGSATGVTSTGAYFESVQGWDETDSYGYDTTITINTSLTPGKGYWFYFGTGLGTTSDILMDLVGNPVTGSVAIPLTNSAQLGSNLIANPYASPIRWSLLRNGNTSVNDAIYIYNADGPYYTTYINGVGTNGGTDIIAAGQGFYVEATAAATLIAQESNKVSSNTQLLKTNSANSAANIGLPIKLRLNGFNGENDETAIRFHGSATNAFDKTLDARKIFSMPKPAKRIYGINPTSISTKSGDLDYSINSLPFALTQNAVIPVLVKVMASGQYTITGEDMQKMPPEACVILKDKLLNVTHNIKASPYVCTINDTTSTARFELTVCANLATGVNNNTPVINDNTVMVKHDVSGVYVDLNFDKTTKANISVTNVLGQKIVDNKSVTTQNETVHFGLEAKNQLLFITVETENSKTTKKIVH